MILKFNFATVNANFQQTNPNFHRLEERFGNRIQSTNWAFQTTAALEKFLPSSWSQTKIPISYSHTETAETPLFVAQNDVNIDTASEAVRLRSLDAESLKTKRKIEQFQKTFRNCPST